jgi:hypothetical protein
MFGDVELGFSGFSVVWSYWELWSLCGARFSNCALTRMHSPQADRVSRNIERFPRF